MNTDDTRQIQAETLNAIRQRDAAPPQADKLTDKLTAELFKANGDLTAQRDAALDELEAARAQLLEVGQALKIEKEQFRLHRVRAEVLTHVPDPANRAAAGELVTAWASQDPNAEAPALIERLGQIMPAALRHRRPASIVGIIPPDHEGDR